VLFFDGASYARDADVHGAADERNLDAHLLGERLCHVRLLPTLYQRFTGQDPRLPSSVPFFVPAPVFGQRERISRLFDIDAHCRRAEPPDEVKRLRASLLRPRLDAFFTCATALALRIR
jgi:hypothetical protein